MYTTHYIMESNHYILTMSKAVRTDASRSNDGGTLFTGCQPTGKPRARQGRENPLPRPSCPQWRPPRPTPPPSTGSPCMKHAHSVASHLFFTASLSALAALAALPATTSPQTNPHHHPSHQRPRPLAPTMAATPPKPATAPSTRSTPKTSTGSPSRGGWEIPKTGARLETTPLVVDGVLYGTAAYSFVFALDAATGEEIWRWDPGDPPRGSRRSPQLLRRRQPGCRHARRPGLRRPPGRTARLPWTAPTARCGGPCRRPPPAPTTPSPGRPASWAMRW